MAAPSRRTLVLLALVAALGGLMAPGAGRPAAAVGPTWQLTIEPQPDVVDRAPVVVEGTVDRLLGGLIGGLDPIEAVTVTLVPTAEGVLDTCRGDALAASVRPSRTRYRAELRPPCNGPYRIEVVARTRSRATSGSPAVASVRVADPGPAPAAPRATGTTNGVLLAWAGAPDPDVVGWRVTGGLAPVDLPAGTTSAQVPASPGARSFSVTTRRWGADGPGGAEVLSPTSPAAGATVSAPTPAGPDGPVDLPEVPGAASPSRTGGGPATVPSPSASGGAQVPARRPGTDLPARRPPTEVPEGYREDLPYGVPDEAFVPGEQTSTPSAAAGDDERAGTSPSASLVRSRERTSPGLVAPFALALLMATVAAHIGWYLRRSRVAPTSS